MMHETRAKQRGLTRKTGWRLGLAVLASAMAFSGLAVSTPVAEAASVSCSPRPRIMIRTEPALLPSVTGLPGQDALTVSVATSGAGNGVRALHLTASTNALLGALDATAHPAPYAVTFAPGQEPARLTLALWRPNATLASFARLVVVDACGEWGTFVGRGAGSR